MSPNTMPQNLKIDIFELFSPKPRKSSILGDQSPVATYRLFQVRPEAVHLVCDFLKIDSEQKHPKVMSRRLVSKHENRL